MYTYSDYVEKQLFKGNLCDDELVILHILLGNLIDYSKVSEANDVTLSLARSMISDYDNYCKKEGLYDRAEKVGISYFDFLYSIAFTYEMIEPIRLYNIAARDYEEEKVTIADIFWLIVKLLGINNSITGIDNIYSLNFSGDSINLSLENDVSDYYKKKMQKLIKTHRGENRLNARRRHFYNGLIFKKEETCK